ncbi:MAG: hypothetical protein IJG39_12270 [Synergistaceae bacterium]|nr:hypothetical protein [Synergistaceae bacterium]
MSYVGKNYSTDGGDRWVIGGDLEFVGDAQMRGFPGAENQAASTAATVVALTKDFNELLIKLKDAGLMTPDNWNLSVRLAPSLTEATPAANNAKSSVALADGVITITADVDALEMSASSNPAQGTHKWVGLGIGTGLSSVALAKYNGAQLTEADANEAASVGLTNAGEFVLYVRAEELVETPKVITLKADGYPEISLSITVVEPE